jgi:uncharacterized membrane protein
MLWSWAGSSSQRSPWRKQRQGNEVNRINVLRVSVLRHATRSNLCAAIAVLVALIGVLYAAWWLAAAGLILLGASVRVARIVRDGRNPRWLLSLLDRRWPRKPD